jgi:hypothetical protein
MSNLGQGSYQASTCWKRMHARSSVCICRDQGRQMFRMLENGDLDSALWLNLSNTR